jgi:hypothetical protein
MKASDFSAFAPSAFAIPRVERRNFLADFTLRTLYNLGMIKFLDYPAAMNSQASALSPNVGPAIASAASLANSIVAFLTPVTGTNAMTGFRLPRGYRGLFVLQPSGASSGATGGVLAYSADGLTEDIPISVGFACATQKAVPLVTDGLKCWPFVLTAAG